VERQVTERTLVFVKPDGVARGLVGEILRRFEAKGLTFAALEMRTLDRAVVEAHYDEHVGRPIFPSLVDFVSSGPVVLAVLEGERAVAAVRGLLGATDGVKATPGTIRGDFGLSGSQNLCHASDSPESAAREIARFFPDLG
jgi:nucleoside-diphosphate kinase